MQIKKILYEYNFFYLLYIVVVLAFFVLCWLNFLPYNFYYVPLSLAFIIVFYGALKKLKERKVGTEAFLVIATAVSVLGGQLEPMTVILLIMLFAGYLERIIEGRTEKEIKSLIDLIPNNAKIKVGQKEEVIPVEKIKVGMEVVVQTGGRIPVDGIVVSGQAEVNESSLTGESDLKDKKMSDQVFAGTFVESGYLVVLTKKAVQDTFFSKITDLVQKAESSKAKISILTDRIAFYLVPSVLIFIGLVWLFTKNIKLVMTLLVFGSPLELTLITPLAVLCSVIAAFRNGILVKGGVVLERLRQTTTLFLDKTGTLTAGKPEIVKIEPTSNLDQKEILKIAAIADKRSGHPIAKAVLQKAKELKIDIPDPQKYESLAGHGIEIVYQNKKYFVGNKHFIEAPEHANVQFEDVLSKEGENYSYFFVAQEDQLLGKIYFTDKVRMGAKKFIKKLQQDIKNVILLSGDKSKIVHFVAKKLGIKKSFGDVFPDEKLEMVEQYQKEGNVVAMVGDGINDAPALKQADIGIAMGAMGMEPAIEAADIVLTTNELSKIVFVYKLSKKTYRIIKQNLIVGFATVHSVGMLLAFLGLLTPIQAALFHAVPDLMILFNSIRLINTKS